MFQLWPPESDNLCLNLILLYYTTLGKMYKNDFYPLSGFCQVNSLWIPYIIFRNTDNDDAITVENSRTVLSVSREGDFVRSGSEVADEIEIFQGEENMITMNQTQSKKFHCTYLLHYFPFDTQICSVDFQLEQFAEGGTWTISLLWFSAAKAAQEAQMSVCPFVRSSIRSWGYFNFDSL